MTASLRAFLTSLLFAVGFSVSMQAQTLTGSLIAAGGATMTDGNLILSGSLGQTVVGTVSATATTHGVGFWYLIPEETGTPTPNEFDAADGLPHQYRLDGNYPNPFNPQTTVRYALPEAGHVQLTVYDALGRVVQVLIDEQKTAGHHEAVFTAHALPSGTYFYRLRAGDFEQIRSMVLLK